MNYRDRVSNFIDDTLLPKPPFLKNRLCSAIYIARIKRKRKHFQSYTDKMFGNLYHARRGAVTQFVVVLMLLIVTAIKGQTLTDKTFNPKPTDDPVVPNIVHLIETNEYSRIPKFFFLNLLSIFHHIKPEKVYFHHSGTPPDPEDSYVKYLLTRYPNLEFKKIPEPIMIFGHEPPRQDYAHRSDIVRMDVLKTYGGIYMDNDILVLRPFDELRHYEMTIGLQLSTQICNGVVIAASNSAFLDEWFNSYVDVDFKCWDCHSVQKPSHMMLENEKIRREVNVLGTVAIFEPSWYPGDIEQLYGIPYPPNSNLQNEALYPPFPGKYAQHLWHNKAKQHLYRIDHDDFLICNGTSMYSNMLRMALDGTEWLQEACGGVMAPYQIVY